MATELSNDPKSEPPISINAQYIKDLSFEAPSAPNIFKKMQNEVPEMGINVNVWANLLKDNTFETVLGIKAECTIKDDVAFVLELEYAGVFTINVPDEHTQFVLLVECPRLLFPFARNIIADISRDGGFQPVMLSPLDFGAMFQARIEEAKKDLAKNEEVKLDKNNTSAEAKK